MKGEGLLEKLLLEEGDLKRAGEGLLDGPFEGFLVAPLYWRNGELIETPPWFKGPIEPSVEDITSSSSIGSSCILKGIRERLMENGGLI